jgi:hypothetical protein
MQLQPEQAPKIGDAVNTWCIGQCYLWRELKQLPNSRITWLHTEEGEYSHV